MQSTSSERDNEGVIPPCSAGADALRFRVLATWLPASVFLLVILIVNRNLFSVPIFEYADFAANELQVESARHFRELLGNYSRWGFHHPGPAFFYLYALGEKLLHDWLHLVPSEMNADILCMVVLNTAFLFGTIFVIAGFCRSRWFPAIALALSLFFLYVVNRAIPGSALVSVWPPYVLLFCFLFFVTTCAALASGQSSQLPWVVLSGLILIHGHVAQPLFVGVLGMCAIATFWWRFGRAMGGKVFLRANSRRLGVCVALIVIFSLPIVADAMLHKDNNLRAILHHMALHPGLQQLPMQSLKYLATFFVFVPDPEIVLKNPSARLLARGISQPYVVAYWIVGALLVAAAIGARSRKHKKISQFTAYSIFQIIVVCGLFYYWTLKMTGALFTFNGYFFFALQLFALLVLAAFVLDAFELNARPAAALGLCVLLPLAAFAAPRGFSNAVVGDPPTDRLVKHLPPNDGTVYHLTFAQADWMTMAGVASRMTHEHESFCVDDLWAFPFGRDKVCRQFAGTKNLILTHAPRACVFPCKILTQDQFELEVEPYPQLKLPFTIKPDDLSSLNKGFNEFLGTQGPVWSKGLATIYFRVAPDAAAARARLKLFGSANPGRPARISLNGQPLGTVDPGHDVTGFALPQNALIAGENRLTIQVDNPLEQTGDPQNDPRVLGFSFLKAEFEPMP